MKVIVDQIENGFEVRYLSDQDGDRYVTVLPDYADMAGWRVEVVIDPTWPGYKHGIAASAWTTTIHEFTQWSYFGLSVKPWSAMVDWGKKIKRWIPPSEE